MAHDPVRFLPLSPQQFHILLALTDGDRHGYGVIQDVEQRTGGAMRLGTGTLYTAIARLVALGLIGETRRRRSTTLLSLAAARPRRPASGNAPAGSAGPSRACSRCPLITGSGRNEAVMSTSSRTVRVATRLHRALLWLVPSEVRREYGAEMIATFEAAANDARGAGLLAVWRLLLHEIFDLAWSRRANRPAGLGLEPDQRGEWIQMWAWRQAGRSLARRPAFFAATVLTLAFGAGVTTAVFSLVDTVLIKPLPYPDADALVTVYELSPSARDQRSLVAPGRLQDWHRLNRSFVAISGTNTESVTDTSGHEPERLAGIRVAPRFFQVYGQQPIAGRWFSDDEERDTGPNAVVISERFWTRRFNRDPSAIGRALTIGGKGYPIVGVMPASFSQATTDLWLPGKTNAWLLGQREARFLNGVGRLKPGVTIEQAAARSCARAERTRVAVSEDRHRVVGGSPVAQGVTGRQLAARARPRLCLGRCAVADRGREHCRAHAGAGAPACARAGRSRGAGRFETTRDRPRLA